MIVSLLAILLLDNKLDEKNKVVPVISKLDKSLRLPRLAEAASVSSL